METRKLLFLNSTQSSVNPLSDLGVAGWEPHVATDVRSADLLMRKQEFRVGLMFLDSAQQSHMLPLVEELMTLNRPIRWIALLAQAPSQNRALCKIVRDHFFDYHTIPLDHDRLLFTLGHAYGMASVIHAAYQYEELLGSDEEMVGTSPIMMGLFRNIRKVAKANAPVLILGESGTGKELTAKAIHERSDRAKGPFVAVNCGALPGNLIQSELFGHEKGAFTGALQRKIGSIEAAVGGTIFLDEIGDLPLEMQVNLLRFLQEKTITRVGGTELIPVDVRVIAATHVDLEKAVAEGRFREDLFYRLNVLHLRVPALRERREDIEVLARYFFDKFVNEKNQHIKGFSQQTLKCMAAYDWPGNVRELINRVRRAMVMGEHRLIMPGDMNLERRSTERRVLKLEDARSVAEKKAIQSALRYARGNLSQAARELDISRVTLYRLMERYQLTNDHAPPRADASGS